MENSVFAWAAQTPATFNRGVEGVYILALTVLAATCPNFQKQQA